MTRRLWLALALLASAGGSAMYVFPASAVAGAEILVLHGFFLVDLMVRPREGGEGREERSWVIVSKIYMLSLLYLPVAFVTVFPRLGAFEVAGFGVTLLGALLSLWGRVSLGRMATERLTIIDGHTLYTGGPYRFIRHPIYSGLVLAFFGHQLAFRFLPGVVIWVLFILFVVRPRIGVEEALLLAQFQGGYRVYQQETWKLFPYIY